MPGFNCVSVVDGAKCPAKEGMVKDLTLINSFTLATEARSILFVCFAKFSPSFFIAKPQRGRPDR